MNHWKTVAVLAACAGMGLSACARLNDAGLAVFASSMSAVAIVNGQLLQGKVELLPNRRGTVSLGQPVSSDLSAPPMPRSGPIANCAGALQFNATASGSIDLRCNDGSTVPLQFALLSETRGYAYGQSSSVPASVVFGMATSDAVAYLTVPANQQLVERGDMLALEPR